MPPTPPETTSSIGLADVTFTVFRHKWKIIFFALVGLAAAAVAFLSSPRMYVSSAKILVRYVVESPGLEAADKDDRIKSPDQRGQTILSSEMHILTSRDLAEQVVDQLGIETVLKGTSGLTNRAAAVGVVMQGLVAEVPPKSSVIALRYNHPDAESARRVLQAIVDRYRERHVEVHRAVGAYDYLSRQTDSLKARLNQTESQLRALRTNAVMLSFDEAKKNIIAEMAQLRSAISETEVELESRKATFQQREKWIKPAASTDTNSPAGRPSLMELNRYKSLLTRLDALRSQELQLLGRYTDENPAVQGVRVQLEEVEKRLAQMDEANPQLALAMQANSGVPERKIDLLDDASQLAALEARLTVLNTQWDRVRREALSLDAIEYDLKDVERRKEIEEANYKYFSAGLERARIDQALDASKISNISVIQTASPAGLDVMPVYKLAGALGGGGIAFGLLLAFLIEFGLDNSVKRPADFKKRLRMPLILTIPRLSRRGMRRSTMPAKSGPGRSLDVTVWDPAHPLRPYFEALRDRVLVSFENDPRRPKLVGVTSCSRGAGSSSLAAGLAASLSETGDGNVLLVDLNMEHGAVHEFFRGKPAVGISDAVENEKRGQGQVQENLYLARIEQVNGKGLARIPSKKIAEMMPRLKSSDYDYIIFDMPPITQTSVTYRMSAFMDRVLLVAESEKTNRGVLNDAHTLLRQTKTNVVAVLNKHRQYLPKAFHHELNGG